MESANDQPSIFRGLAHGVPVNHAGVPQCTQELYDSFYADRHLVHGAVAKWARERPDVVGLIDAEGRRKWTWHDFYRKTALWARELLRRGFSKGDFFVTVAPLLLEHLALEYACFRIGVIFVPLDVRLKANEIVRSITQLGDRARGFGFMGKVQLPGGVSADFGPLGPAIKQAAPSVTLLFQFCPADEAVPGAVAMPTFAAEASSNHDAEGAGAFATALATAETEVAETDGCLVIFTTGSTGAPKPALLSHRGITVQNMCMCHGLQITNETVMVVNLPPSHVGCQTEQLMSTLFAGGTAVCLPIFSPAGTLQAISEFRCTMIGQIPAMFALEWRLPNYEEFDLGSLRSVLAAGQAMTRPFMERVSSMAPVIQTGLGQTEASGFTTYTSATATMDEICAGVGFTMPVYTVTIREPMKEDGSAGAELPAGQIGEICYHGPQNFIAYINNAEAFRQTVSTDGHLYSGDLGFADQSGIHLSGRRKFVLKPKGYQVFPPQVEELIAQVPGVKAVAVVGVEHHVDSEGLVALVEADGGAMDVEPIKAHMKEHAAAYMRPLHYIVLPPGGIPLNRTAKTDYLASKTMAQEAVAKLRAAGGWDASAPSSS